MNYPRLCSWMQLDALPDGRYGVTNCTTGERFTLGSTVAYLARMLDGKTDPFAVLPGYSEDEVQEMLDALEEAGIIRYGSVLYREKGSIAYSLIIPERYQTDSILPVVFNTLLMVLWLPVFVLGVACFLVELPALDSGSVIGGQLSAILIGGICHEAAHACAALGYGGRVFEAGVLLMNYMPGAYVLTDHLPVKRRLENCQILMAGVEMNMLLAGIGLLLSVWVPSQSGTFFGLGIANLLLALTNLTFSDGLDGMAAMEKLLGVESLMAVARYTLTHKSARRRFWKAGPHGVVELLICCLLLMFKAVIPLLCLMGILEVLECFF